MIGKFIKLLMVAVLLFTATIAVAGSADVLLTVSERTLSLCAGESHSLKVYAVDTTGEITNFRYQWYYNQNLVGVYEPGWVEITDSNRSIITLRNVTASTSLGNAGYYYCRVFCTDADDVDFRNSEKISVEVLTAAPTIGGVTAPSYVCEGTPLTMTAFGVDGASQRGWYYGDVIVSHGTSYTINSALPGNAGEYKFVASNACGSVVHGPYQIGVVELPRIVTQPRSAGICAGDSLRFIVGATGDSLHYQWYYDGSVYPAVNHTDTTYMLTIAQAEHDPELYSNTFNVQVSNVCATVTSHNVGTVVSEMPRIVGNPEPTTVCAGIEVTLYADATTSYPDDPITYQWYLNGAPVENSDTNAITFAMDSAYMGEYYCEFTNGCGTVRGNTAQVNVKMPATVESQPESTYACEGEAVQLYAKITGVEPISYTWKNSNGEGLDFTDITTPGTTGVHTSTLVADPVSESHERYYYCVATNECGSVYTDTVYITVTQHITIYPPAPMTFSACSGIDTAIRLDTSIYLGSTRLDADEFEDEGINFAWHKEGDLVIISTEPTLHFANLQDDETGRYVCDITNSCGTVSTNSILVSVMSSPVITVQPHDLDVCRGMGNISISLTAEGDGLRYVWYRNGEYIGNNNPTYNAPGVAPEYGGTYYCKVESEIGCPTVYSDTILVTVGTPPSISWQPTPAVMALCEGSEYGLRMRADGDGIHYQWYNNGTALEGQTTDSLHISAVTRENNGIFYCIASNACDDVRTENATLTVNAAPDMTLGPDLHPCQGQSIILAPHGFNGEEVEYGHYSWNHGTFGYQPTLTVSLGGTYILEVSDSAHGSCVARDTVVVTFHNYFDIAFDTTSIVTCGEFVLDAGAGAAEYMWSTTDQTNSITVAMNGYYMVTVDGDGYGCTSSAAVNVVIGEAIVIDLGDDITISEDSIVEIGVPPVFESYVWNTGYTGPRLTVSGEEYGVGPHTFWVQVSNGGCFAKDTIVINFLESGFVAEESMPVLSIYPNPASDFVNIVSENGEMSAVQVYDMTGRLVVDMKVADEMLSLNVASLVDSTYFVKVIYRDGKVSVGKLIINR